MKLVELANKAIFLLKEAGEKGYNNIELAQKLHMPRRRVYDIIAILRAAGLVEAKREKGGTRIKWKGADSGTEILSVGESPELSNKVKKLTSAKENLEAQVEELKERIQKLKDEKISTKVEVSSTKTKFDVQKIIIRTVKTAKITKIQSSPIEIVLEADKAGFLIEPI